MIVNNTDIAGLVRRIRRIKYEVNKCQSASLMYTTDADLNRFQSYIDGMVSYFNWMTSQPMQDLPESHPKDIDLGDGEVLPMPENEGLVDMLSQLDNLEAEMGYCQSARMHSSMMSHDENRFRDIVQKVQDFMSEYLSVVQPLDMPESTPLREMTGAGRKSVKK